MEGINVELRKVQVVFDVLGCSLWYKIILILLDFLLLRVVCNTLHALSFRFFVYDSFVDLPQYTCNTAEKLKKHSHLIRLMQFLIGVDEVYASVRSNILIIDHIPNVKSAFATLSRDESYRNSNAHNAKCNSSAFVARSNNDWFMNRNNQNRRIGHPHDQVLSVLKNKIDLSDMSNGPCEVHRKAKQTRELFPLSDHKTTNLGQIVHLDVGGHIGLPSAILSSRSPYKLVYKSEPNLSYLTSFGCLCFVSFFLTLISLLQGSNEPYDEERDSTCKDDVTMPRSEGKPRSAKSASIEGSANQNVEPTIVLVVAADTGNHRAFTSVHKLSQDMHGPLHSDLKLAFRVLRYLKGALGKGVFYKKR
nr:putative reverse transcriptase, RNA-dependent DNA polymerase, Gag-polypeptide of LTR copia-type [Tanacetum cinerariifolium]